MSFPRSEIRNPKSEIDSKHPIPITKEGAPSSPSLKQFSFWISEDDQGKRFDQFLAATGLNLSRSQAKRWIEEERILLNGKATKPSVHLRKGDQVSGSLPAPVPLALQPEPLPLSILYEDASIIVIDKPAGMVVHPAPGNLSGTLVNALIHHCKDLTGINGALRPGIVHRLDKGTSGVMVVAKDDVSYHQLTKQFKNRTIDKVYLAIARGKILPGGGVDRSRDWSTSDGTKEDVHTQQKGKDRRHLVEGP